jgi:3-oxoacyl-[acyl-carrier protein] reductase
MGKLMGKTAIVTGASRGIGAEIAKYLAKRRIAVNYSGSQAKAEEVVNDIVANGGEAFAIQASVSDADSVS